MLIVKSNNDTLILVQMKWINVNFEQKRDVDLMCSASEFHNLIVEGKNELEYEVVRQKIGTKLCGKKCLLKIWQYPKLLLFGCYSASLPARVQLQKTHCNIPLCYWQWANFHKLSVDYTEAYSTYNVIMCLSCFVFFHFLSADFSGMHHHHHFFYSSFSSRFTIFIIPAIELQWTLDYPSPSGHSR